jgi:hypothetical protein
MFGGGSFGPQRGPASKRQTNAAKKTRLAAGLLASVLMFTFLSKTEQRHIAAALLSMMSGNECGEIRIPYIKGSGIGSRGQGRSRQHLFSLSQA